MNSIKGENSMATKVNTYRTTAKVVGALYILGFVVGIVGSVLGTPGQLDTNIVPRKVLFHTNDE